jgi:DeoR/GlpR family transcriptional regulator of sugar metabolism
MKPKRRQARIADLVSQKGAASVEALAQEFAVSAETIRRDLSELAEQGIVQKIHGGARRSPLIAEGNFVERMGENAGAKDEIAQKLVPLVVSGDKLFMDTGSTTLACAYRVARIPGLTVITNSVRIANVLSAGEGKPDVILLGGEFRSDNGETVGPMAIEQIRGFQADHAVITVAAIDATVGAMDAEIEEAHVARAMIDCSQQLIVVADSTKLGRKASFRVCKLDEIDVIVTDRTPAPAFVAAMEDACVAVR